MKKAFISICMIMVLLTGLLTGCRSGSVPDEEVVTDIERTRIGVSLWSSDDVMGSRCKDILCETADVMGVELVFEDNGLNDVPGSVDRLIDQGCRGIIVCSSAVDEMSDIIKKCDESGVYVIQVFRRIDMDESGETYAAAKASRCYIGAVHEDEVENGRNVMDMLLEAGARNIGVIGTKADDGAWLDRYEGFKSSIDTWNDTNKGDPAVLLEPRFGGVKHDGGSQAAAAIIEASEADGLICAGGGGEPLIGALSYLEIEDRRAEVKVAAMDFVDDLGDRIKREEIIGASGGSYCDPMFALILVGHAIESEEDFSDVVEDLTLPYIYVNSYNEFEEYSEYFDSELPYTDDEIAELLTLDTGGLTSKAKELSIDDAASRAQKRK